jgi:ribokinase
MVDAEGNNSIVIGESSTNKMIAVDVEEYIKQLLPAGYFVTGFEIDPVLALAVAKIAKCYGLVTLLNPSPLPENPIGSLEFIDYLILNEKECHGLSGIDCSAGEHQIRALFKKLKVGCIILTRGSSGCSSFNGREFINYLVPPQEAVDTTGAGDAFLAAFVANLVWGKDLQDSCRWANAYASYTVTRMGTINAFPCLKTAQCVVSQYIKESTN